MELHRPCAHFADSWGLLFMALFFVGAVIFALRPGKPEERRRGRPHPTQGGLKPMSNDNIDEVSGVETTGHEWDGIRELNNPLPRWWLWTFYFTIVWALGYTIAYPAWPLIHSATRGAARLFEPGGPDESSMQRSRRPRRPARSPPSAASRYRRSPPMTNCAGLRRRPVPRPSRSTASVPWLGRRRRCRLSEPQRRRLALGRDDRRDLQDDQPWHALRVRSRIRGSPRCRRSARS